MLSVSYVGKNAYSAGKTCGVLRGGASGANRCYVLAHCAPPIGDGVNRMEELKYCFLRCTYQIKCTKCKQEVKQQCYQEMMQSTAVFYREGHRAHMTQPRHLQRKQKIIFLEKMFVCCITILSKESGLLVF